LSIEQISDLSPSLPLQRPAQYSVWRDLIAAANFRAAQISILRRDQRMSAKRTEFQKLWVGTAQSCLSATANTQIDLQGDWWIILSKCSPDRFHDIIMECEKVAL